MKDKMVRRFMLWFFWTIIAIAFGYFWHMQAVAYGECMAAVHPAGWVEDNKDILAAKRNMGPLYEYTIVDRILYVDTGNGQLLRLEY